VPLHASRAVADHEAADGLLGDRSREHGVGQGERAADHERLVVVALEPLLDVEIEAGQSVVLRHRCSTLLKGLPTIPIIVLGLSKLTSRHFAGSRNFLNGVFVDVAGVVALLSPPVSAPRNSPLPCAIHLTLLFPPSLTSRPSGGAAPLWRRENGCI
jgi:hypothetical protein